MNFDWHNTQNDEYIELLKKRLDEPRLKWVDQFWSIIFIKNICKRSSVSALDDNYEKVSINDFGCNVGHFYRGCLELKIPCIYTGYDISESYLKVARQRFGDVVDFNLLDISKPKAIDSIKTADVSVISATLEHIQDFTIVLKNIFEKTRKMVLIRTFLGENLLSDFCLTDGAKQKYLIRQFRLSDISQSPSALGWSSTVIPDLATSGERKAVCNSSKIYRKQYIILFEQNNEQK